MYKANVNDTFTFDIDLSSTSWDVALLKGNKYHILYNNQSYVAELLRHDIQTKTFTFGIDGEEFTVSLADKHDQLITKMGLNASNKKKSNNLKAPMPGLVLEILVEQGQQINAGESLVILEAMKMENVLKAEADGVVKSISVNKGQAVDKNAVLLEFE